jgi:hypothetical protein
MHWHSDAAFGLVIQVSVMPRHDDFPSGVDEETYLQASSQGAVPATSVVSRLTARTRTRPVERVARCP